MIQKFNHKCGLANLGNTCYMNSALQCLMSSPELMEYFLNDLFQPDINLVNPMGSRGEVVTMFAQLLKDTKLSKKSYVIPHQFKKAFCKFRHQYYGEDQHDAAEFLLDLLDCIHEDLNLVKVKPYTVISDSNGRDELVVALEHWEAHQQRNQSIVADLFQAQYKSKMECPYCKNISITFDPYMSVQLPLNCQKSDQGLCYYVLDQQYRQRRVDLPMFKNYNLEWLKGEIRDQLRTEHVIFDLCSMEKYEQLNLEESIQQLKKRMQGMKILTRIMSDTEIYTPYQQRVEVLLSQMDPYDKYYTEPSTIVLNKHMSLHELFNWIEKELAIPNRCGFEVYIKSNSDDTQQLCYFCSQQFCKYCRLCPDGQTIADLKDQVTQPEFKLNFVIKWFPTANPINFNCEDIEIGNVEFKQKGKQYGINLYDCLSFFQQQQQLDEESWYCKGCKKFVSGIKQLQLYSVPQILIIHLKRFKNGNNGMKTKNNIFVRFPLMLDMNKFVINKQLPNEYLTGNLNNVQYKLGATINHIGEMDYGHYTTTVFDQDTHKWYFCDDSKINEVHQQDVITENAYILMYYRI